jgi:hypothetical protein
MIIHYNIFQSNSPLINQDEIGRQRISTILFVILLGISFVILSVYTALEQVTTTISIDQPDYKTYHQLYLKYSDGLSCSCTNISIEQGTFIQIQPKFHPICTSDFVSSMFLNQLLSTTQVPLPYGYIRFQFLGSICRLANASISESIVTLKKSHFVLREVLSINLFNQSIHEMIDQYTKTVINSFVLSLSFIRHMTFGNKLMSGLSPNNIILVMPFGQTFVTHYFTSFYQDQCDCMIESCTEPIVIQSPDGKPFVVPGLYWGCYAIDFILKSDLQCFYDLNCTRSYLGPYNLSREFHISILDPSTTRFPVFTSIDTLIKNLFVENWTISISHVDYFNQCKPSTCSYRIETKNSLLTILTITIGFLGGIQVVLRFLSPKMVEFIYQRCFARRHVDNETETDSKIDL